MAFYGCDNIESLTYNTNAIGSFFSGKTNLKTINIGDSVTSIGYEAFRGCRGLTSVTIPNSVTSIGKFAFYKCSGLTSATIPNSVTEIGSVAFWGCSGLTSVTIGNSVTSIGSEAFYDCSGLTSVTIPNSVTSIGEWAFSDCSGLTSVTIPNSVTSIGEYAFRDCRGLTSVTIPNSVTSIGSYAFFGCDNLTIYCETSSKPDGWDEDWNYNNRPVVWGYKNLAVKATSSEFGSVEGVGTYEYGDTITLTVIAAEGYHFVKWSDGNTENPRTIIVTDDITLTAEFAVNETQGDINPAVAENAADAVSIYAYQNIIVVENTEEEIYVFDVMGRLVARENATGVSTEIPMQNAGIYIVKVGAKAQRVSVSL